MRSTLRSRSREDCVCSSPIGRSFACLTKRSIKRSTRIKLVSLTEGFDTGTPLGRLTVGILASIAAWQRETIVENVNAGLDAARERGQRLGRPNALDDDRSRDLALAMQHRGSQSAAEVAARFGVSRATAYRALGAATQGS